MAETGGASRECHRSTCYKCKQGFDDIKGIIECTECNEFFHGKCESVDLRGFHLKKTSWKCKTCTDSSNRPERSRKRSRVEDLCIDQNLIDHMNCTLDLLVSKTNALNEKVDILLAENISLKEEIAYLKSMQVKNNIVEKRVSEKASYASVTQSKVLVVNQKGAIPKDIKKIKEDLKTKVNPTDIGIGVTLGRATKKGGLILNCGTEKEITNIQSEIQSKLGESYSVDRPKMLQRRIKVVGVNENENVNSDSDIITKIILKSMKNVGGGENGISKKVLCDVCSVAGNRLLNIVNTSLSSGVFPEAWKVSTIIPVPKVLNTISHNEFRPINTVEVYEKVLEIAVKEQLQEYCDSNDIFVINQSGFRERHSCESAVINICDTFLKELDKGNFVLAVFLDFKRAFETGINQGLTLLAETRSARVALWKPQDTPRNVPSP
ncbi:uncharacterized protein LOC126743294 [Anthonomus grandis grandis]|uniref:uncharacterized protein LOC126743294 n=1 Tax=Anthonomus grandis grandis TaxID=2921223 RepID=UPI0021661A38|nr:uncharacterized protein LOC126743294 [Anthonomus grandis grandis]